MVQRPGQFTVGGARCVQLFGSFVQLAPHVNELLFQFGDAAV
ncbi:hypothetical protein [Streptomyces collinus]